MAKTTTDHDEIRRWVVEVLAPYKAPTHIDRWDGKLPRNATGKVLRGELTGGTR